MRGTSTLAGAPVAALVLLVVPALAGCGADAPEANPPVNGGALHRAFEEASLESGVPQPLLMALGWYETRWSHALPDGGTEGHDRGCYGLMQLCARADHDTLGLAAALSERTADELKKDRALNVLGAALVLRRYADEAYEGAGVEEMALEGWRDVVARWSGESDPLAALEVVDEVWRILQEGAGRTLEDGEEIELPALEGAQPSDAAGPGGEGIWGSLDQGLGAAGVRFTPAASSNYTNGRGGHRVRYVVVHTMQGSYAGSISWFRNPSSHVSAHYCLRSRDGDITQMVDENDTAWHAGNWSYNQQSIGLEHEGFVNDAAWYTDAMYRASARLVCDITKRHDIPVDREHILGHVEVPGASHTDPGRNWDWGYYLELIKECRGGTGGSTGGGSTGGGGTGGSGGGVVRPGQGTLQGVVYADGDTSRRIAGAAVSLSDGQRATSNSNGYWSLRVAAGTYTVSASAAGYRTGAVVRAVTAGGSAWASVNLVRAQTSELGRVSGIVFEAGDSSRRLAGVHVSAAGRGVDTDASGRYTLELPAGEYAIDLVKSGWLSKQLGAIVRAGRTTTVNAGLSRPGAQATVVGVVYRLPNDRDRIAGARVTIAGAVTQQATTGADGYFRFQVPAGAYRVTAFAAGYGTGSRSASAIAGAERWASVGLSKGGTGAGQTGTLVGIVYEAPNTAKRLAGATVTLSDGQKVTTDANGLYRVTTGGRVTALASHAGYAPRAVTRFVAAGATIWGSIGLSRGGGTSTGTGSEDKCNGGDWSWRDTPREIVLRTPVLLAETGPRPTFEFGAAGDPTAAYRLVLVRGDDLRTFEFEVEPTADDPVRVPSPRALETGVWSWGVHAVWPAECARSEITNYGFFSVIGG